MVVATWSPPCVRDATTWLDLPPPSPCARDATHPDQVPVPAASDATCPEPVFGLVVASWPILTTQEASQSVLVPCVRFVPLGALLDLPAAPLTTVAMPPDPAAPLSSATPSVNLLLTVQPHLWTCCCRPPWLRLPAMLLTAAAGPSALTAAMLLCMPPLNVASLDLAVPRVEEAMCQACAPCSCYRYTYPGCHAVTEPQPVSAAIAPLTTP
ncbi:proline-rich protein 36-like isoform X1 [Electrophorus electricus]|uniref:proline-rich protein 36-like isoform X1 n=1 Tax=Electrophorus electricus TaxID=8005 RepID=UPI0015D04A5C|nr:proline-rich protein 36-like isoform X1 [Electrophorus electricus]XP_035383826.1 proline-rich protein 36-like isoform X1 [Electrophorus electricus]XP_035383827.1 proline-rich protein 36-like isoform X1 [Electrophorus electricus]